MFKKILVLSVLTLNACTNVGAAVSDKQRTYASQAEANQALFQAAMCNFPEQLDTAIADGASLTAREKGSGYTAFDLAAIYEQYWLLRRLYAHIRLSNGLLRSDTHDFVYSPLMNACTHLKTASIQAIFQECSDAITIKELEAELKKMRARVTSIFAYQFVGPIKALLTEIHRRGYYELCADGSSIGDGTLVASQSTSTQQS